MPIPLRRLPGSAVSYIFLKQSIQLLNTTCSPPRHHSLTRLDRKSASNAEIPPTSPISWITENERAEHLSRDQSFYDTLDAQAAAWRRGEPTVQQNVPQPTTRQEPLPVGGIHDDSIPRLCQQILETGKKPSSVQKALLEHMISSNSGTHLPYTFMVQSAVWPWMVFQYHGTADAEEWREKMMDGFDLARET